MAFPTVESVTEYTNSGIAASTHDIPLPATVDANDLLVIFLTAFYISGDVNITGEPSGFSQQYLYDGASATFSGMASAMWKKKADGTEDGTTVSVTLDGVSYCAAQVYRITGWSEAIADVETASGATGQSTSPNPPSVTASWGSDDNLFIAACHAVDDGENVTSAPTNYTNLVNTTTGANLNAECTLGSARRQLASDSDDPDSFTLEDSEAWRASTTVIKPATAGGGGGGEDAAIAFAANF